MLLQAENLVYHYKNKGQTVKAVDGVSLNLEGGRFYALTGKSGSGKSTLLSLLAGLETPQKGQIRIEGAALAPRDFTLYRRHTASVIFQAYNLFPQMTALENVLYPLLLGKRPRQEAEGIACDMLERVELTPQHRSRLPRQLSGGEQQRVAIARSLAAGTKLILADEPTGNLDEGVSAQVMALLVSLTRQEGRCVLMVTHDLSLAREADQVFHMESGKLKEAQP